MVSDINFEQKLKSFHGIVIREYFRNKDKLKFLTSEGDCYIILDNSKYKQLKEKVGQCIYVTGNIFVRLHDKYLEVLNFKNEFEGSICTEENENLYSSDEMSNEIFFDYESIFT